MIIVIIVITAIIAILNYLLPSPEVCVQALARQPKPDASRAGRQVVCLDSTLIQSNLPV